MSIQSQQRAFLRFLKSQGLEQPLPDTAAGYRDYLLKHSIKASSVQKYLQATQSLYESNGWAWPKLHVPDVRSKPGPALTQEEVQRAIRQVRRYGRRQDQAAVAVATTWGPRVSELHEIFLRGFSLHPQTFTLQAKKHGEEKEHWIPEVLRPILAGLAIQAQYYEWKEYFHRLFPGAPAGYGWHSVRKAVVTGLRLAHLSDTDIGVFMRWRSRLVPMLDIYTQIGPEADLLVLEKHPFVHLWEESIPSGR